MSKILIADDRFNYIRNFRSLLGGGTYQLVEASSGEEAIEKFDVNKDISLLITDQKVGEVSGLDVIKHMREVNNNIPFILMSSMSESHLIEYAQENEGIFISKFDFGILDPKLPTIIDEMIKTGSSETYTNLLNSRKLHLKM